MKKWKRRLARMPVVGSVALKFSRTKFALRYYRQPLLNLARWLFNSKEVTNFTYDLAADNQRYLAATIAHVLGADYLTISGYIDEAINDVDLRNHIAITTTASSLSFIADHNVKFGKRLGWYAFVRALKPSVVVETGVDKGLGACLLAAALMKNAAEGNTGRYFGTDINPDAGYLLSGKYAEYGELIFGDSVETLRNFDMTIDLFINDSDHSAEYEAAEYTAIGDKISENAIVLGDNSHVTCELLEFSLRKGREFLFFAEKPSDHWYPGGGIGISFSKG